jgi:hypothetical protein
VVPPAFAVPYWKTQLLNDGLYFALTGEPDYLTMCNKSLTPTVAILPHGSDGVDFTVWRTVSHLTTALWTAVRLLVTVQIDRLYSTENDYTPGKEHVKLHAYGLTSCAAFNFESTIWAVFSTKSGLNS